MAFVKYFGVLFAVLAATGVVKTAELLRSSDLVLSRLTREPSPQGRDLVSFVPCNFEQNRTASCQSCSESLLCMYPSYGILTKCTGWTPYCRNGHCSSTPGAQCSTTSTDSTSTSSSSSSTESTSSSSDSTTESSTSNSDSSTTDSSSSSSSSIGTTVASA